MTRRVGLVVWLMLVWVVLWSSFSLANLASGLLLAVVLVVIVPPRGGAPVPLRPLAALHFAGWFAVKLVQSNLIVAWEVATPGSRVAEGIVAVPLDPAPDGLIALVADAVSLTPGTLTVEVRGEPPTLYVHVLHLHSPEATRREVQRLDHLARAAFLPAGSAP